MAQRQQSDLSLSALSAPAPQTTRRAWGKVPYEERFRRQHHDLMKAAEELGAAQGISGTSVADIARVAGVSKRVFYEHFADKEACFVELARKVSAAAIDSGTAAATESVGLDARAAVLATVKGIASRHADPRFIVALRSEAPAGSALAGVWAEHHDAVAEIFVGLAARLGSSRSESTIRLAARVVVRGVDSMRVELRKPSAIKEVAEVFCLALGLEIS